MRADAWELSSETKIQRIEEHFREIMHTLGLDLKDDSLQGTPRRVAKMLVSEIFSGLNPEKNLKSDCFRTPTATKTSYLKRTFPSVRFVSTTSCLLLVKRMWLIFPRTV